jgi:N-glycosylase/DNA lyase
MSIENEAKKLAATYARWLRNPQDALFGKDGEGVVLQIYKKLKQAKDKNEILEILKLDQYTYTMEKTTLNDMARFISDLLNKIQQMDDQSALRFTVEVFRYFQIALATKLEDMNKGLWA